MTKYIVRKLDFGYLVNIKKKILYLKPFSRIIRFKNKAGIKLKKNKFFINRSKMMTRFKGIKRIKFNEVLNKISLVKRKFSFYHKVKLVLFKVKRLLYNYIKFFFKYKLSLNIKFKIKMFKNKKKQYVRHYVKRLINYLKLKFRKQFRSKFVKLEIRHKIKNLLNTNFNKKKTKAQKKQIKNLRKEIKYAKSIGITYKGLKKQKYKFNRLKKTTKIFFFKPRKKKEEEKPRQRRKRIFLGLLNSQIKREKKKIKKITKIRYFINKIKGLNLTNILVKTKFKLAVKNFSLKFKRKLKKSFQVKSKYNKLKKPIQIGYTFIILRKLKIKYYVLKAYVVANKYLKNDYNLRNISFTNNFYISGFNIKKYSNLYTKSLWIKFFLNFIYFYFFKYCNVKSLLKRNKTKKKKFRNNLNFFSLDRPSQKLTIKHIFETQNSFFFFRFIRLSKKILDLFSPIKNKFLINSKIKNENNNTIYYSLILKTFNKELYLTGKIFNYINTLSILNISLLNNFFFLILCNVKLNNKNLLVNKIC